MPSIQNSTQVSTPNQSIVLPEPSVSDKQHSQHLKEKIIEKIHDQAGKISFEQYMQMALYETGLGYYSAGSRKFGAEGDFITAPEISPVFSQVLAIQSRQILEQLKKNKINGDILEFGAGSGKMALAIMLYLEEQSALPDNYYILDLSADLIDRQKHYIYENLKALGKVDLYDRFKWLDHLPRDFNGVMLANEVLDAMPTRIIKINNEKLYERFVGTDELTNKFIWIDEETNDKPLNSYQALIKELFSQGLTRESYEQSCYITEVNTQAQTWVKSIAEVLNAGAIILIDYGYTEKEYFHPQRNMGTLMCHYRHHSNDDPFYFPGLQDITAHVNFSDVKRVAELQQLDLQGFTTQAHFLMSGGLQELSESFDLNDNIKLAQLSQQIKRLTLPNEMGELFKVICFSKQIDKPISGFDFINMKDKL